MSTHPPTLHKPSVAASGIEHDALPAGTRFGEFEILRVLGVGGFGIVYLAQDHSLERRVALKEYMPASLAARGAGPQITVRSAAFAETYAIGLRSFINEARLLARFDHPSLVKVYRFWEDNATAYMVMPYLQGTTLRDMRRASAHPPDEFWIRSVVMPILSALELLHREGVYHRDVAPDNILLPPDGPPVLLDFGAARRVISDRTQSLTAILKPSYAPIEQYAEMTQLRQGPWTDLYALGAVIHYLVFGAPPSPATARAVQDDAEAVETRIVPGVSPRFLEAMSWMLAVRPNDRPQSGEQLRAVLDGAAEVPLRRQPGTTLPRMLGRHAVASAPTQVHVRPAETTSVATAFLPTFMPTALSAPPGEAKTITFSPVTQMPTVRQGPVAEAALATVAPTLPMPMPSEPTTVPAAMLSASPAMVAMVAMVAPVAPAARRAPTQATALSKAIVPPQATARPARSKVWLVIAACSAGVAALALAGWQYSARQGANRTSVDAAAPPATATVAPAVANARPAPPAMAAVNPGAVPTPIFAAPAPALAGATAPVPVGDMSAPGWAGSPMPAPPVARAPAPPTMSAAVAAGMAASLLGGATSRVTSPSGDGSLRSTTSSRGTSDLFPDRGTDASAGVRVRPAARPAMRIDEVAPSTALRPVDRAALAIRSGSADERTLRPGPGTSARDLIATPRSAPIVDDETPTSAREACGKRRFIAMAICMDTVCEEARFRATPECIGVLSRKATRDNR